MCFRKTLPTLSISLLQCLRHDMLVRNGFLCRRISLLHVSFDRIEYWIREMAVTLAEKKIEEIGNMNADPVSPFLRLRLQTRAQTVRENGLRSQRKRREPTVNRKESLSLSLSFISAGYRCTHRASPSLRFVVEHFAV